MERIHESNFKQIAEDCSISEELLYSFSEEIGYGERGLLLSDSYADSMQDFLEKSYCGTFYNWHRANYYKLRNEDNEPVVIRFSSRKKRFEII